MAFVWKIMWFPSLNIIYFMFMPWYLSSVIENIFVLIKNVIIQMSNVSKFRHIIFKALENWISINKQHRFLILLFFLHYRFQWTIEKYNNISPSKYHLALQYILRSFNIAACEKKSFFAAFFAKFHNFSCLKNLLARIYLW